MGAAKIRFGSSNNIGTLMGYTELPAGKQYINKAYFKYFHSD